MRGPLRQAGISGPAPLNGGGGGFDGVPDGSGEAGRRGRRGRGAEWRTLRPCRGALRALAPSGALRRLQRSPSPESTRRTRYGGRYRPEEADALARSDPPAKATTSSGALRFPLG